ncbi:MAG: hypothetical protein L3J23_00255 [Flavobacteriaceae bacterium]|nr:hypothetical protein [Flavobacteriaceae bacterium]
MDKGYKHYLRSNIGKGVSISSRSDSLNLIHFLNFKNDTVIWKTKKNSISTSFTDVFKISNFYFLLQPNPRTLGKNLKSTYTIIKSDEKFNEIWRKELNDIPVYPNAKSFILKKDSSFIYISNRWERSKKGGLVLREYNLDNKIIKEKIIESNNKKFYKPISIHRIDQEKFIVISDRSNINKKNKLHRYEITMFDFNFNIRWKKEINLRHAEKSLLLKKNKRLLIIDGYADEDKTLCLYNIKGDSISSFTIPDFEIHNITIDSNDNFFILGENKKGNKKVIKYDKDANIINDTIIEQNNFTGQVNLIFRNNTIYLYNINEEGTLFRVDKLNL